MFFIVLGSDYPGGGYFGIRRERSQVEEMVRELLDAASSANVVTRGGVAWSDGSLRRAAQDTALYIERALEIGGVPAGMNADDHDGTDDSDSFEDDVAREIFDSDVD